MPSLKVCTRCRIEALDAKSNEVIPSRDFDEVAQMIAAAKQRTYSAVNSMLVELYWQVGAYIHNKLESAAWGEGVVDQLATYLKTTQPTCVIYETYFGCGNFT